MTKILYDSTDYVNTFNSRIFNVAIGSPMLITAAGLDPTQCVPIYMRVGDTDIAAGCSVDDGTNYIWTPLMKCGDPVMICGDSNRYVEYLPGTYIIGDPTIPFTMTGNVSIVANELKGMGDDLLALAAEYCPPKIICPTHVSGLVYTW